MRDAFYNNALSKVNFMKAVTSRVCHVSAKSERSQVAGKDVKSGLIKFSPLVVG